MAVHKKANGQAQNGYAQGTCTEVLLASLCWQDPGAAAFAIIRGICKFAASAPPARRPPGVSCGRNITQACKMIGRFSDPPAKPPVSELRGPQLHILDDWM